MKAYINHIHAISRFEFIEGKISEQAQIIEPDYESILDVRAMRRLSKILKMGLFTALSVKNQANLQPNAIICGTALGCLADTYQFLKNMSDRDEQMLTPTAFIQSTHNTLAGTLGIMLQDHCYNITWSNREFSFFDALEDAVFKVNHSPGDNILVTAADEMPQPVSEIIDDMKLDCPIQLNSEGAASFWISSKPSALSLAIESMTSIDTEEVKKLIAEAPQGTVIINTNPFLSLKQEENVFNLIERQRSLIDDAFGLVVGCNLMEYHRNTSTHINTVFCIGGNASLSSLVKISS